METAMIQWLSRTIKEEKEKKKAKAFEMWLACHTQEEIAEAVDVARPTIVNWEEEFVKNSATKELTKWSVRARKVKANFQIL